MEPDCCHLCETTRPAECRQCFDCAGLGGVCKRPGCHCHNPCPFGLGPPPRYESGPPQHDPALNGGRVWTHPQQRGDHVSDYSEDEMTDGTICDCCQLLERA
jgi:hypothetical protein